MTERTTLLPTHIAGLDSLLGGGLSRQSLVLIVGAPGAGKTALASQIVFNAARAGVKALVFTSYSEGNEQYVDHMRGFAFFDESLIGDTLQLFTMASQLAEPSVSPATALARTIRASGAKVVLLDGFQGVAASLTEPHTTRATLSSLAKQLRYLDATLLVTMAGSARDPLMHTELTIADITINLDYSIQGRRHQRLLDIVKLRGRAQRPGVHSYAIDNDGIEVFPRIESVVLPEMRERPDARSPFGLPELDRMLGGGPNIGTTTLIAGALGVGKTTIGLHWALHEAQPDARTLFITFGEHPEQLQHKARAFGLDLGEALRQERIHILRLSSVDLNPDKVAALVLAELASGEVRRVVFDDMTLLFHELGSRVGDYLAALNDIIYSMGITSLYLLEIPPFDGLRLNLANTPLGLLGDNVIIVQQYEIGGMLRRLLAVLRMRLSFFDHTLRELVLSEQGVHVLQPKESGAGLLATGAALSGGIAPTE